MSPPRLLVTGGSGYLGGELVRRATAAGWSAVGTSFRSPGPLPLDVRDRAAVAAVMAALRPDCVIHTAYLQDGPDAWATNVDGTANVAEAAAAAGARLVHLSTDLVFDGRARAVPRGRSGRPRARLRPLEGRGRTAVVAADPSRWSCAHR